jgi:nicotinamidase-related amidase
MKRVYSMEVCETLEEILEPRRCALVPVDIQNDAMRREGKIAKAGQDISMMLEILPRCSELIGRARELGIFILHVQTVTLPEGRSDSPSWWRAKGGGMAGDPEFMLAGTWGADICEECAPLPGEPVVTKHRSSAFRGTNLDLILRANGVETVVLIGEQTPGCIEATYRDAAYHDYYNMLVEDCVGAFDRELHEASIKIQRARHDVCLAEGVLSIWREAREHEAAEPAQLAAIR